ncbi:response regulator [Salegentibacter chungangensis]|uniref:Two-component system response regulator n=1 Tax=Salegentibacter chungangensis TaxID=1335724 RepID=A0ABW3NPD5_9FLAO
MKKSICVIDDDEIYQVIISSLLRKADVFSDSYFYTHPERALKALSDNHHPLPDVILLDINMPGMDGWEFLDLLCEMRDEDMRCVEIYIVTSSIARSDKEKAAEYDEVSGFISKPVGIGDLKQIGSA